MAYYVDKRINEVVKDLDINFLAPELFYELKCSEKEDIIIETWNGTGSNNVIDYTYNPNESEVFERRTTYFTEIGFQPFNLISYAIPPILFEEYTKNL